MSNFSEKLVSEFYEAGLNQVFLVTGGAISPFTTALVEHGRFKMNYMLHEQSAAIAAEAYGSMTGFPALLVVTSGPGVTNALTGVAAGYTNSSPMIIVSGQARSTDIALSKVLPNRQHGNQHVDTPRIVDSIVKMVIELEATQNPRQLVQKLVGSSTLNRKGPSWLSIPQDIQRDTRGDFALHPFETEPEVHELGSEDLKSIVLDICSSKRPAILIGAGARDGIEQIQELATYFRIPIMTTWPGMDLVDSKSELFVGRPGSIPSGWAPNLVCENCDYLLVIGARMDLAQVGYNPSTFAGRAKITRVDVDESELGRLGDRNDVRNLLRNSKGFTAATFQPPAHVPDFSEWWNKIDQWKSLPNAGDIPQDLSDGISTYLAVEALSRNLNGIPVVTGSSGTCIEMLLQSWKVSGGQRIINSCGIGSMGFALPGAIGVSSALPNTRIACIESDGSLAMNLQDLVTVQKKKLPLAIFILDSGGYKSISLSQKRLGQTAHGINEENGLYLPAPASDDSLLGIPTKSVHDQHFMEQAISWCLGGEGPRILFIRVSESEEAFPRLISKPDEDGRMTTPAFGDLSPALQI